MYDACSLPPLNISTDITTMPYCAWYKHHRRRSDNNPCYLTFKNWKAATSRVHYIMTLWGQNLHT
jgi:hypothetical protein